VHCSLSPYLTGRMLRWNIAKKLRHGVLMTKKQRRSTENEGPVIQHCSRGKEGGGSEMDADFLNQGGTRALNQKEKYPKKVGSEVSHCLLYLDITHRTPLKKNCFPEEREFLPGGGQWKIRVQKNRGRRVPSRHRRVKYNRRNCRSRARA